MQNEAVNVVRSFVRDAICCHRHVIVQHLIDSGVRIAGNNRQANGDTYDALSKRQRDRLLPFIVLQGGNGHHDGQQSANVQSTRTDVGHHSDLASTFAHFWHHG